jgi:hypothetical protein
MCAALPRHHTQEKNGKKISLQTDDFPLVERLRGVANLPPVDPTLGDH